MTASGKSVIAACIFAAAAARAQADEPPRPVKARPEVLLPPDSDSLAWRYDMKMADWSCSNAGCFYELDTPELIERRIKEVEGQGFNTITMSGFHMHNCFLDRWPRITQHAKRVVATAHRRGIKVVFHHDVPVLTYNGRGLHELIEHPDWLARDIEHDRPTLRAYCIMNPDFRKTYFDRMEKVIVGTRSDMKDTASSLVRYKKVVNLC